MVPASVPAARGVALMRIWAILAAEGADPPKTRGRSITIVDDIGRTVATVPFDEAVRSDQAIQ